MPKQVSVMKTVGLGRAPDLTKDLYADPSIKFIVDRIVADGISIERIAVRSGLTINTITNWRRGVSPGVGNLRALLNALGYDFKIVPLKDTTNALD